MEEQELKEVIERAKNGNEAAKNIIIKYEMQTIKNIANNFYLNNKELSVDDLIQDGVIAVLKAIDLYNIEQNVKFSTYAYGVINLSILSSIKKKYMFVKVPPNVYIHDSIRRVISFEKNGQVEALLNSIEYKESKFDYINDCMKWKSIFKKRLTVMESKVILKIYFENKTSDLAAQELNISKRKVSIVKYRALKKLKKFKKYYEEKF